MEPREKVAKIETKEKKQVAKVDEKEKHQVAKDEAKKTKIETHADENISRVKSK